MHWPHRRGDTKSCQGLQGRSGPAGEAMLAIPAPSGATRDCIPLAFPAPSGATRECIRAGTRRRLKASRVIERHQFPPFGRKLDVFLVMK